MIILGLDFVFILLLLSDGFYRGFYMKNKDCCSLESLLKLINERKYIYNDARPYHKFGRKIISYAPVPYVDDWTLTIHEKGDIEGWINELPIGALIYMDEIVGEEKYSTIKFEKMESDLFVYSVRRSRNAGRIDGEYPF